MKKIFVIDWTLIPLFLSTALTGFGLHIAGHGDSHDIWHNWAVFHIISSLLFLITVIFHVYTHWNWYVGLIKRGLKNKSLITILLSVAFLFMAITGIISLKAEPNSHIGLWHYISSIVISSIALLHIILRLPILAKSLKQTK